MSETTDTATLSWQATAIGAIYEINPNADLSLVDTDRGEAIALRIASARTVWIAYDGPDQLGRYLVWRSPGMSASIEETTASTNRELVEAILRVVL